MKAFHSFWTRPMCGREPEDFEILTMVLSALKWREKNGEIYLITDLKGKEIIENHGFADIWNEIRTDLEDIPRDIDYHSFWAAGKLYGLKAMSCPVVSIDTDFIVWDSLELDTSVCDLMAIHKEELDEAVYPDLAELRAADDGYDWSVSPVNAAFMCFKNEALKDEYTAKAIDFMTCSEARGVLVPMVFAEQRLLSMIAKKMGINTDTLSTVRELMSGEDKRFTHLWGYKRQVRENPDTKKELSQRLKARLKNDYNLCVD